MYNKYRRSTSPYSNSPMYSPYPMRNNNHMYPDYNSSMFDSNYRYQPEDQYVPYPDEDNQDSGYGYPRSRRREDNVFKDYGPNPMAININEASKLNNNFRTVLWTGDHLQVTLMSINVGEDIGYELHPDVDQFICIEDGQGVVLMGDSQDRMDYRANVYDDIAFVIPAGKWHNLFNTGNTPLKLFSIYAPPQHPHGTVHKTKESAEETH